MDFKKMVEPVQHPLMLSEPELRHYAIHYGPEIDAAALGLELSANSLRDTKKRRAEYTAGRYCAHKALEGFSVPRPNSVIGSKEDRCPSWPSGFVGSITHVDDFAWSAVGLSTVWKSIGIDTEKLISRETFSEIHSLIATHQELSLPATTLTDLQLFSLIFSAKESVFKCLYPLVQQMFDFTDVSIVSVNVDTNQFMARTLIPLGLIFPAGSILVGRFALDQKYVYTSVTLPQKDYLFRANNTSYNINRAE
jgi:enterobactin synthetase component D